MNPSKTEEEDETYGEDEGDSSAMSDTPGPVKGQPSSEQRLKEGKESDEDRDNSQVMSTRKRKVRKRSICMRITSFSFLSDLRRPGDWGFGSHSLIASRHHRPYGQEKQPKDLQ